MSDLRAALFFVLLLTGLGTVADADDGSVARARLVNGLRVIIVHNSLAPVVTTAVNYLVGADETPADFPGMAHAQEHMMFRGSPGLSADQLAVIGSAMGGQFNAETRQTVTQYSFTVPAEDLDVALQVEALRMRDVLDRQEDWERERGAIEQEVDEDLSNPTYVLDAKLRAILFAGTSYAHDGLGTRASFDRTTGAMLKDFHDRWYVPNNAVLVVVGNIDPLPTLGKVKRYFESIPPREVPDRSSIRLQPVQAQTIRLDSDLPYGLLVVAFRLPGFEDADYAAAEVLADVLSSKRADLYGLVAQGKALFTDLTVDPLPKATLAYVSIAYPNGTDVEALEREVQTIFGTLAREGVSADLIAAAKLQEKSSAELQKNSIEELATVWSEAVAVQGLTAPEEDLTRIEKVTVGDVKRVAQKYLDLEHAVTAILTPRGNGAPVAGTGFGEQETALLGEARSTVLPHWAEEALNRLSIPVSTVHPVVFTLPNGITLVVQREDVSDTVSVYGRIRNRAEVQVPDGQEGLSEVLDDLFSYGTERLDRLAFERALDEIGAQVHPGTQFSAQALAQNFDRAVELLAEKELHPALSEPDFAIVKAQVAKAVADRISSPAYVAEQAVRKALLPAGDPLLREARPETIEALTLKDLHAYYQSAFRPDLATIVVIGRIDPEKAKAVIEKYFGAWTARGSKPETDLPVVPPNRPSVVAVPDASTVQADVTLAQTVALTRADPDYYALQLGNEVLDGGFYSTRLSRTLREESGLVYSVDAYFVMGRTRGAYFIEYACDPQNVSKVQATTARELDRIREEPVSPEELQLAKARVLREMPLNEASLEDIAEALLERSELDLPLDEPTHAASHYLNLSARDVQAAFAKWIRPGDLVRVSRIPE